MKESLDPAAVFAGNGSRRTPTGGAQLIELVGCGKRVLVVGAGGDDLLLALKESVCDVTLVAQSATPGEPTGADALCERVIRRLSSVQRLLADLAGAVFDAIVLDGAAATTAGLADLRPLVDGVLGPYGLLVGRLPPGTGTDGLAPALLEAGLALVATEQAGRSPAGTDYVACRLPRSQLEIVAPRLAALEHAERDASDFRRLAAELEAQLEALRANADQLDERLAQAAAERVRRDDELAALHRTLANERSQAKTRAADLEEKLRAALTDARRMQQFESGLREAREKAARSVARIQALERDLGSALAAVRVSNAESDDARKRMDDLESRDYQWRRMLLDAHEQLLARDEELAAALSEGDSGYLEYRAIVARVRELVATHLPADVPVAVASKGDEELLELGGRPAWHLPQTDDGVYAGHHLADGIEVVEHLEALRARGAGFFVLPGSSWWWLEHYPELAAHLERHHEVVVREEGMCLIVDLRSPKALAEDDRKAQYEALVARLRELVAQCVPARAGVVVATKGDDQMLELDGRTAWHLPQGPDGVYAGHHPANSVAAIAQLEAARVRGAEFFVLPETQLWWLEHYDELAQHLDRRCRVVARADGTGVVYRLSRGRGWWPRPRPGPTGRRG